MSERIRRFAAYTKRYWMPSAFVVVFGAFGVVLLIRSFALTPDSSNSPSETITVPSGQSSIELVKPIVLNASTAKFSQTGSFPLTFTYPLPWKLYKMDAGSTASSPSSLYVRLLSPDANINGESHSSEFELGSGALIEITADTNNQFTSVDKFVKQLGANGQDIKIIRVHGTPAAEYRIPPEDATGDPPKLVTTFLPAKRNTPHHSPPHHRLILTNI